jgi:succinate-semialdehyde dehydrogenase / glutarate-semialdehyde dehydrogenase
LTIQSTNPATGEPIETYDATTPDEIDLRLEKAHAAFESWRDTSFAHRAQLLIKAAAQLRENNRSYAHTITVEMGKPISQSIAEVEKCAAAFDFYAEHGERFLASRPVKTDARESYVRYDPLGPILAVMPWNFPFWQVIRFAAPTLMAGNVGVLKHASNVPGSALAIERLFREAGFPEGIFTTLLIGAGETEALIKDRRIRAVTLTGSETAGRKVASTAGWALKKTVLELGGSDPFIVLADADVAGAAHVGATARLINAGQSCIAAKRFIVHEKVADEFLELFSSRLREMKVGDPMDEATEIGPMARSDLRLELHDQVERSVSDGATLRLGGAIPDGPGYFYPVTLLTEVGAGVAAGEEETFGPLAAVIRVDSDEEAIAFANRSEYGLASSLWTTDLERAGELARRVESGAVFVNGMAKSDPRLPFGGVKNSGYGRELSEEGIREFVNVKSVWIAK